MMLFTVAYITLERSEGGPSSDDSGDNVESEEIIGGAGTNAAISSGTGSIRTNKSTVTAETYLGGGGETEEAAASECDMELNRSCECLRYPPPPTNIQARYDRNGLKVTDISRTENQACKPLPVSVYDVDPTIAIV